MQFKNFLPVILLIACLLTGIRGARAQNVWSPLPSLPTAAGFASSVSYNGKIYLFGGASPNHTVATNKAYIFNPADSSYTALPDMPQPTSSAGAVEVDGKIYVMGGSDGVIGSLYYNTNYIFDPATGVWETGPPMPHPRLLGTVAAVEKKIYVIGGGVDATGVTKLVDVYDTETKTWSTGVDLPLAKAFLTSAVVDNKIYVFGGTVDVYGIGLSAVHIFDPSSGKWTSGNAMPTKRFGATAVAVDGTIYLMGGSSFDQPNPFFATVEKYNPQLNKWQSLPSMLTRARGRAAAAVDKKIYVFGGMSTETASVILPTGAAEVFNAAVSAVGQPELFFEVSVFPNPAGERVIFQFPNPVSGVLTFIRPDGRVLYTEKIRDGYSVEISTEKLCGGLLLWQFQSYDGQAVGDKIVIMK